MKSIFQKSLVIILMTSFVSVQSCKKNKDNEENTECKTCKAFKSADKPEATAQVCSGAAEQTFRSQHTGQEISCQ